MYRNVDILVDICLIQSVKEDAYIPMNYALSCQLIMPEQLLQHTCLNFRFCRPPDLSLSLNIFSWAWAANKG